MFNHRSSEILCVILHLNQTGLFNHLQVFLKKELQLILSDIWYKSKNCGASSGSSCTLSSLKPNQG